MGTIWIRNRSWDTVNVSNMIVFIVTIVYLTYKLSACHIGSSVIVVEVGVSSG